MARLDQYGNLVYSDNQFLPPYQDPIDSQQLPGGGTPTTKVPGTTLPTPPGNPWGEGHELPVQEPDPYAGMNPQDIFGKVTAGLDPTSANLDKVIAAIKGSSRADHNGSPSDDKIMLGGKTYDTIFNVGGDDARWQWLDDSGGDNAASGSGGLDTYLQQLIAQGSARAASADQYRNQLKGQIQSAIDQYGRPVDPNDPVIHNQVDAYRSETDHSLANWREMAAERTHAEGVPSGAFDSQLGSAIGTAGRGVADFQSGLIGNEVSQRRNALATMLGESRGVLGEQDQSDLAQEMAAIDANLKQQGLNNSFSLGSRGLDLTDKGLNLNNQQYYDNLARLLGLDAQNTDDPLANLLLRS